MIKKLLKNNYFITLAVKILSLGMAVISGALLARFLGTALKGQFASLESVTQVISVLMNFGIYHLYPKMVKDKVENARQKLMDIFIFQFMIYLSCVIIAYILTGNVNCIYYGIVAIMECLVAQLTMMCMVEFPIYRSLSLLAVSFANLLITVVVFIIDVGHIILVPVSIYILKDLLFCILILSKLKIIPNPFKVDFQLLVKLMKEGFIPMLTALLLKLNYKVDVIMLSLFNVTDSSIGVYSIGISIASQLWIIPETFKEVLYSKSTEKNAEKSFVFSLKISTYSLLFINLIIVAIGYWGIKILYGMEFIGAYKYLVILVIGVPFMGVFNIVNPYYLSMGQFTIHMKNLLFGVISNIIVNALLIVPLGAVGAAIATSISQVICGIFACYQFSKSSNIPFNKVILLNKNDFKSLSLMIGRKQHGEKNK